MGKYRCLCLCLCLCQMPDGALTVWATWTWQLRLTGGKWSIRESKTTFRFEWAVSCALRPAPWCPPRLIFLHIPFSLSINFLNQRKSTPMGRDGGGGSSFGSFWNSAEKSVGNFQSIVFTPGLGIFCVMPLMSYINHVNHPCVWKLLHKETQKQPFFLIQAFWILVNFI